MTDVSPAFFLPGAGGVSPVLPVLKTILGDISEVETVRYPGWQRYVADGFTAQALVAELAQQIADRAPDGPIRIVGMSLGGHLGYAIALHLQAAGREIAGFCAIDSFMVDSSAPSAGWKGRAVAQALELLRKRRFGELFLFLKSKFWRALLRLSQGRLQPLFRKFSAKKKPAESAEDSLFQQELSMRLLLREVAPWVASLDREPVELQIPAVLLRTSQTARDDAAWRRRCPHMEICEVPGQHHTLFEPENVITLREAYMGASRQLCKG